MAKEDTQFQVGHAGGPGRPKGSKNKLSEPFVQALAKDFEKHGKDAIERLCEKSPGEYLRIIAGLIPKEFLLEVNSEQKPSYVINALPSLTNEEWVEEYAPKAIDSPESVGSNRETDKLTE